jgi:hypothetical protein
LELVRTTNATKHIAVAVPYNSKNSSSSPPHRRHSLTSTTQALDMVLPCRNDSLHEPSQQQQLQHCSTATSTTNTMTSTTNTTTRKKRVRFLKRVTYHPAANSAVVVLQALTEDECIAAWYNARNYKLFKSVLHNETMDAREAIEYQAYRDCFATVWDACRHGHGHEAAAAPCAKEKDNNDNVPGMKTATATLDWRDMLRPLEQLLPQPLMSLDNSALLTQPKTSRCGGSSPARQLAASRFRGLERTIFARLVMAHRVAATRAVVQAYQVISDESYKQRSKRVRQVAQQHSKAHQRMARVYAYGDAQLVASWRCREAAAATAPMGAVPREGLSQRPALHSYDSQDSLDSVDGPSRLGRRHRAKRRTLLMADPGESTRSVDSIDSQKHTRAQGSCATAEDSTTSCTAEGTATGSTDAFHPLNHDFNVTISRRHRTSRRRLGSSQASCRNLMSKLVVEPEASVSIAT